MPERLKTAGISAVFNLFKKMRLKRYQVVKKDFTGRPSFIRFAME